MQTCLIDALFIVLSFHKYLLRVFMFWEIVGTFQKISVNFHRYVHRYFLKFRGPIFSSLVVTKNNLKQVKIVL